MELEENNWPNFCQKTISSSPKQLIHFNCNFSEHKVNKTKTKIREKNDLLHRRHQLKQLNCTICEFLKTMASDGKAFHHLVGDSNISACNVYAVKTGTALCWMACTTGENSYSCCIKENSWAHQHQTVGLDANGRFDWNESNSASASDKVLQLVCFTVTSPHFTLHRENSP